jgi:peptide/nickel transport system substrate-binding protein
MASPFLIRRMAAAAVVAAIVGLSGGTTARAADRQTLVIGVETEPQRMDPHSSTTWHTFRVLLHVFEGFVEEDLRSNDQAPPRIIPALAESWDVSPDGKTYTFHLRKGVTFHDGTPWNAIAAKFNLDRMTDEKFEYYQKAAKGLMRWVWADLESYRVVDEYTFEIKLKNRVSDFIRRLASGGSGAPRMVSPTAAKNFGTDGIETHPVGTGPYKYSGRIVGESVRLERNDDYWDRDRRGKTKSLIFRGLPELASRESELLAGEVDIIATPSPYSIPYLERSGMKIVSSPVPTLYLIWVNHADPILKNPKVREALCMAMDRPNFVKSHRRGYARPAYGILNFGGPGYNPDYRDCTYDPAKAKALLAEAGYPNGFSTRLLASTSGGGAVGRIEDATWFQRDFARIGVTITIDVLHNKNFWDVLGAGMPEGIGFMDFVWGESTAQWLDLVVAAGALPPSGFNAGRYNNPEIDKLLLEARSAPDEAAQVAALRKVQQIIGKDHAWLPTYIPVGAYAMRPNVSGFVMPPEQWADFTGVVKN